MSEDQTTALSLPCDTYECDDRLWCIQRHICKRQVTNPASDDYAASFQDCGVYNGQ